MPRIYIAGPMSGLPESNYPAFNAAALLWREEGWDVENPAEHFGGAQDKKYVEYVNADIVALEACDAIAMLPNWDAGHSGAIWEHAIAVHLLKLPVYDATKPAAVFSNDVGFVTVVPPAVQEFVLAAIPDDPSTALRRHPVTGALGRWSAQGGLF